MATFERLPLLTESMRWEEIPPGALQEARLLTKGAYGLLPEYRGALRPERIHTTDPDAIDRLLVVAAGDPAMLATWEARCCVTQLYRQVMEHLDQRHTVTMARRRAPFAEWVDEATQHPRYRVLMHALMDFAIRRHRQMPERVIGLFPTYFRKIHDPLVTLSVMRPGHAKDLLLIRQNSSFSDESSPAVAAAFNSLMANWVRHNHGLDINDRSQHRLLMTLCRSRETGGDLLALHRLAAIRRDSTKVHDSFGLPDAWDSMASWVRYLPEAAFSGAQEGSGLRALVARRHGTQSGSVPS